MLCFSADDLPPLVSLDSVTWPSLSTIVSLSENATDLRGLRSASCTACQNHNSGKSTGSEYAARVCVHSDVCRGNNGFPSQTWGSR